MGVIMGKFGDTLRQEREFRGITLDTITQVTKTAIVNPDLRQLILRIHAPTDPVGGRRRGGLELGGDGPRRVPRQDAP